MGTLRDISRRPKAAPARPPAERVAPAQSADRHNDDFYEIMPAATAAAPKPETEDFGDRLQDWWDEAKTWPALAGAWLARIYRRTVAGARPLRPFWLMAIGIGALIGLLIIAYLASQRSAVKPGVLPKPSSSAVHPSPGMGAGSVMLPSVVPEVGASSGQSAEAATVRPAATVAPVKAAHRPAAGSGSTVSAATAASAPTPAPLLPALLPSPLPATNISATGTQVKL